MEIGKYNFNLSFKKKVEESQNLPLSSGNRMSGASDTDVNIKPGRETEDPNDYSISKKYSEVKPDFALEWLPVLENMASFNPDFGYAVDNIVQLSNTAYNIEFADGTAQNIRQEISKLILDNQRYWYSNSGGLHSFRSDILAQAAINGAMSCEIVPTRDMLNIKLIRIPPKYIRFLYNKSTEEYEPFQLSNKIGRGSVDGAYGLKKLNTVKYKYIAWRRLFEGPYPTPPFLTAVNSIDTHTDIINNLKFVVKQLGSMGFLAVNVTPPTQEPGETKKVYYKRCLDYLENDVYPQLEKNLAKGIIVGFKGTHEFKLEGNKLNVQGAAELVDITEKLMFAGFKQDPNMMGRNFSTTETFGRVILAKMSNQVKDYQTMLNGLMYDIFRMFITLRGYDPNVITGVTSDAPTITDKLSEEDSQEKKIDNVVKKRNENIIDQATAANELGYEEPAGDAPVNESIDNNGNNETQNNISEKESILNKTSIEYDYRTNDCNGDKMTFIKTSDFGDSKTNKFAKDYTNDIDKLYSKFIIKAANDSIKTIQKFEPGSSLSTIQDSVYITVLENWENYYSNNLKPVCDKNVESIYEYFRKDTSVFPEKNGFAKSISSFEDAKVIPDPLFGLDDFRSIDYMAESDTMYLGKFITDENTKKKLYNYIEENYISGDLPFGNSPEAIKEFKNEFTELYEFESYKIRRIIDTSVNNIRNDANLRYIQQAEIEKYQVIEIGDQLTCEYCTHMNGMIMSVEKGISKINTKSSITPQNVSLVSPFVTKFKVPEFTKMNAEELQLNGFSTPSYHASCRGRIVAL